MIVHGSTKLHSWIESYNNDPIPNLREMALCCFEEEVEQFYDQVAVSKKRKNRFNTNVQWNLSIMVTLETYMYNSDCYMYTEVTLLYSQVSM